MSKKEIARLIAEIDAEVKKETGVDLAKLDKQLTATRKVFAFDLRPFVLDNEVFLVKSRLVEMVH